MKIRSLSAISLLLALLLTISLGGCNDKTAPPAETTAETTAAPVRFTIDEHYTIIRPDEDDEEEIQALKLFRDGIRSVYGLSLDPTTDFVMPGADMVPGNFEVLIGATNRESSKKAAAELSCLDWIYRIDSAGVITICGGSPEATGNAVRAFLSDMFGYEKDVSEGKPAELTVGTERIYRHSYRFESLSIGGVPIEEYTVVRTTSVASARKLAKSFCHSIERLTGKPMKTVTASEFTGGRAIYFGNSGNGGKHFRDLPGDYGYIIREVDGGIAIDFSMPDTGIAASEMFMSRYISGDCSGSADISLGKSDVISIKLPNTNGLVLKNEIRKPVAAGIEYVERIYRDENGKPVRAYILSVAKGAATLCTGTPRNGTELEGKVSNVSNQMKAADEGGKKTIAGINADFFDMGGTCLPRGLCIKDGKLLTGASDRPWFGIRADGSYVIGNGSGDFQKLNADGTIFNAVGGSHILLDSGKIQSIPSNDFSTIRHPRTAVGYDASGKVFLIVVDGRQPTVSNGASLADLAEIFFSLGCTDALNLDGGGSTTMILKDAAGNRVIKNSPSDGSLRAVSSTLLVCER